MLAPKKIYSGKKVLVLGLGLNQGGVGSAEFFAKAEVSVRVTDLKTAEQLKPSLDQLKNFKNIQYTLGGHKFEDIDWADLIIRNPKLTPDNSYLRYAKKLGKKIEMDMGIFLQFVKRENLIGITGTKGKSTTSSLIYSLIKTSIKNVLFAGNIGRSVLDTIPFLKENSLVILELSSFQLEAFDEHKTSPKYAVITNIYPDHLDYYEDFKDYINSKKAVAKYQEKDDFLFLCKDDKITTQKDFLENIKSKVIYYSSFDLPKKFKPKLKGIHNLENIAASIEVGISLGLKKENLIKRAQQFKGVEFRLQFIKQYKGIKIYNDTAATNPSAALMALVSFPKCILITGGLNKGLNYKEFAEAVDSLAKEVYFLEGSASDQIQKEMLKRNKIKGVFNNFTDILSKIKKTAKKGDIVLLSPGAASFNLFQNEFDRGRKFNQSVIEVFK